MLDFSFSCTHYFMHGGTMNILFLRLLILFYVCGLLFLMIKLISSDLAKNNRRFLAIVLFPICLASSEGRAYLKKIIIGKENKK